MGLGIIRIKGDGLLQVAGWPREKSLASGGPSNQCPRTHAQIVSPQGLWAGCAEALLNEPAE